MSRAATRRTRPHWEQSSRRWVQVLQSGAPVWVREQGGEDRPQREQGTRRSWREQFSQRGALVSARWQGLSLPQNEHVAVGARKQARQRVCSSLRWTVNRLRPQLSQTS